MPNTFAVLGRTIGMISRILSWVSNLIGRTGSDDRSANGDAGSTEEEGGFVPSRMDASVLEGHGMNTVEAEQELTELQEQGERLQEEDRQY